jgi:hypothetical protein
MRGSCCASVLSRKFANKSGRRFPRCRRLLWPKREVWQLDSPQSNSAGDRLPARRYCDVRLRMASDFRDIYLSKPATGLTVIRFYDEHDGKPAQVLGCVLVVTVVCIYVAYRGYSSAKAISANTIISVFLSLLIIEVVPIGMHDAWCLCRSTCPAKRFSWRWK